MGYDLGTDSHSREGMMLATSAPLIEAEHISYSYGEGPVLDDVSLSVQPGEYVALVGLRSRPVNELSGGQQQRTFIARTFASEPDLMVLDEPIAGIDRESQERFRDSLTHLIAEHGAGVLLVSHELSAVARDLDRVIVLRHRVLFDGPPGELMATGVSLGIHREDLPLWLEGLG